MELKITTLIENREDDKKLLINEHGLSMYIEFEGKKILFDTGQTKEFIKNARMLHKPVENIDYLIVSHGHYDHSGGVIRLVENLEKATPMYVGKEFFDPKYKILEDGTYKYNGNPFKQEELDDSKIILHQLHEDINYIDDNIIVFKNFRHGIVNDFELLNQNFVTKLDQRIQVDQFADEIVLGLRTAKGMVLLVGCSHVGICNIVTVISQRIQIPIYAVIGGIHLVNADDDRINKTIAVLKSFNLGLLAVSHCTGETSMERVKKTFDNVFEYNNTGHVINI